MKTGTKLVKRIDPLVYGMFQQVKVEMRKTCSKLQHEWRSDQPIGRRARRCPTGFTELLRGCYSHGHDTSLLVVAIDPAMIASTGQAHVAEDTSFVLATAPAIPESAKHLCHPSQQSSPSTPPQGPSSACPPAGGCLWGGPALAGPCTNGSGLLDGLLRLARFFSFCASALGMGLRIRCALRTTAPSPVGSVCLSRAVLSGCLERSARAALRTGAFKTSILHSDHVSACSFIALRSPAENEGYLSLHFCCE